LAKTFLVPDYKYLLPIFAFCFSFFFFLHATLLHRIVRPTFQSHQKKPPWNAIN
jgi:hypothetical protein